MSDDDVFSRRWVFTEDELLRMLWRCYGGESPDVVLVELHAHHHNERRRPSPLTRHASRSTSRATRHVRRGGESPGR